MNAPRIVIARADPRAPQCAVLIGELDRHLMKLYPAESNHLMDLDALSAPDVRFFTATVDGDTVGCGAVKVFADYTEVKRVYVSSRARGLGVAMQLVRTLESATRDAGLALMRLETGIHQPDALSLFERMGFSRTSSFGDYPKDDPYSVFMERRLP